MQPSPQANAFVAFAEQIAFGPYPYSQAGGRCDPIHSGHADCSGLVVASANAAIPNLNHVCTGSFGLAREANAAGMRISVDEARNTHGALCFLDPWQHNGGMGGNPGVDPGHVAISRGDGTIVEARNHNAGILISPFGFFGGWDGCYKCPWFPMTVDAPAPPPVPKEKKRMFPVFYSVPEHPKNKAAVWISDGFRTRHVGPHELASWQWIIAAQGGPHDVGTLAYGDHMALIGAS